MKKFFYKNLKYFFEKHYILADLGIILMGRFYFVPPKGVQK